jgi:hypothetical protein
MTADRPLQKAQIQFALAELDQLANDEYGQSLHALLLSREPISELRMQRLVGLVLKRKFVEPNGPPSYTKTGAKRSWPWPDYSDSLVPIKDVGADEEIELLDHLRMPGPWNKLKPLTGTSEDEKAVSWSKFKSDLDSERGLFKVVALWVGDKINKNETKTIREYFDARESRSFEAGLDFAQLLFETTVTASLVSLLGIPALAVGVTLVGIRYGYRAFTDPDETHPAGDINN